MVRVNWREWSRSGLSLVSQQALATDAQRAARNLEDLHFTLLNVVVDRAPICINNLCSCRYLYDFHVLTAARAPDLLPLHQRGLCLVHCSVNEWTSAFAKPPSWDEVWLVRWRLWRLLVVLLPENLWRVR